MLSDSDRTRWGQLMSRVDLSAEEKEEMDALRRLFYEEVHGSSAGIDFDVSVEDLTVEALSEAAKREMPNCAVAHDREKLMVLVKQLEDEGFKMRWLPPKKKAG
jgi:hypothetical protein